VESSFRFRSVIGFKAKTAGRNSRMVVNVNLPTNFSIEMPQLKDIQEALARLEKGGGELRTVLLAIDQRTNEAAGLVAAMFDQMKDGLSAEEAGKLIAKYAPLIDALNAIAKNGEPTSPPPIAGDSFAL
jgi:hypothetical protein